MMEKMSSCCGELVLLGVLLVALLVTAEVVTVEVTVLPPDLYIELSTLFVSTLFIHAVGGTRLVRTPSPCLICACEEILLFVLFERAFERGRDELFLLGEETQRRLLV